MEYLEISQSLMLIHCQHSQFMYFQNWDTGTRYQSQNYHNGKEKKKKKGIILRNSESNTYTFCLSSADFSGI